MLKLSIVLLIALVLNPIIMADDYTGPTDNELMAWWNSLDQESKVSELRKLDNIEHAQPKVIIPQFSAILSKDGDLFIMLQDAILIDIDYLSYEIEIDPVKIAGFYKPKNKGFADFVLPVSFSIGASLLGTAFADQRSLANYGVSAIAGLGLGLIFTFSL